MKTLTSVLSVRCINPVIHLFVRPFVHGVMIGSFGFKRRMTLECKKSLPGSSAKILQYVRHTCLYFSTRSTLLIMTPTTTPSLVETVKMR